MELWATQYVKLAEDDKPSVIPGLVSTGLGASAAAAMPALSLHEYLTKTHPGARNKIRRATEVKHRDLAGMTRPGDTILHGPLVGVSPLATANNVAGTLPSGLPATHAALVAPDLSVVEGGHMLEDSIHGPINDQTAWRLYGRKDSDETLLSRVKDPIKRKRMLEKLRREHRHIRAMAGKGRAALLSGTKGPSQSEAIALHKIDEFRSPQKDVEKYLSSIDEQRRPQMALRRSNGVPLTSAELESLAKQIEIDKLTPYGASRGALAGLKSLMLPSGFSLAKANRKLCDPETNICSSVPARAYRRLIPGSKRSPSDTLPGHLLTEFNTAPVAITRKKEWLRQLENTKRNRTLAGLGLVGLAGLLGGGLGYAGYNLTRDRDA